MTYSVAGTIQAADYNNYEALTGGINEVFGDIHSGATTLGALADFGYGQTSSATSVSAGDAITTGQWNLLFNAMRSCGLHQGTTVVPPVPASNPTALSTISVYNTPSALSTAITSLRTNRHVAAVGQSTLTTGSNFTQPGPTIPWTNTLVWNYQVDFGSWNNARYFFNAGGYVALNGSYSPSVTSDDAAWITMLSQMSPLQFNWNSCTPGSSGGGTAIGFYNLTTSYQIVYNHVRGGGGAYTNNFIKLQAKLNAAAGTNGKIDFSVTLDDLDPGTIPPKNGTTVFRVDNSKASGAIVYPGPSVSVASVGANSGFIAT